MLLTCFRLAKEWGVSPWKIRSKFGRRELMEWHTYFTYKPPAGERIDCLIAHIKAALSDKKSNRLRKFWPEYGPKTGDEQMTEIKNALLK